MNIKTAMRKGRDGWKAESMIALHGGERIEMGDKFLQISTYKARGGLLTTCNVSERTEFGFTHAMFQDYMKQLTLTPVRCTEKSVQSQHEGVLQDLDAILAAAKAHYEGKQ